METHPIQLDGNDKLHWLRRLDTARFWEFLDDQRYCSCCGKTFSGRQIQLVGGSRPFGPLRAVCPTRRCAATPADWIYLREVRAKPTPPFPFRTPRVMRIKRKVRAHSLEYPSSAVPLRRYGILRAGFTLLRHVGVVT
jgi:hypothetical protein